METRSTTQARDEFADLVNAVAYRGERVVLTRRGKAIAALVPVDDLEVLEAAEDHADIAAAKKVRREEPIRWADVKADLGL